MLLLQVLTVAMSLCLWSSSSAEETTRCDTSADCGKDSCCVEDPSANIRSGPWNIGFEAGYIGSGPGNIRPGTRIPRSIGSSSWNIRSSWSSNGFGKLLGKVLHSGQKPGICVKMPKIDEACYTDVVKSGDRYLKRCPCPSYYACGATGNPINDGEPDGMCTMI